MIEKKGNIRRALVEMINERLLRGRDVRLVRASQLYPWQLRMDSAAAPSAPASLTPDALAYLTPENPRLAELRQRYGRCEEAVTKPLLWVDAIVTQDDLKSFRGDNAYVWQLYELRGPQYSELGYALTTYYTLSAPEAPFLARMSEDGAFGVHALEVAGRLVSRDILDSAREIAFLTQHVTPREGPLRVLDIGAGYGRLPHRLTEVLGDSVRAYATDGFPTSSFLAEFYLRYRRTPAEMVPLDEFDGFIGKTPIDVAVNIHSFSECTLDAIEWWISRLARAGVPNLMVIPNEGARTALTTCRTIDGHDMEAIFTRYGYSCAAREFRYADPLVRIYGIDPAQLTLFRLG